VKKKKLIALLGIQAILIIVHRLLDKPPQSIETWHLEAGWHYWVAMGFGIYLVVYILSSKCPACNKPQVYRGVSPSQWHWPPDRCWNCGTDLVHRK
jgi:hypothetical protein